MIKAAIIDLDGTLVDSNDLHAEAWQKTFLHYGREVPYRELRQQIGKGGDQYLPVFWSAAELRKVGAEMEEFRGKLFRSEYLERVRPFPKVKELLERLRDDGKRIALASSGNADEVEHYVNLAGLGGLVEARTTKSDVEHSKPSPDVFTSALHLLQVQADEAIVIGDTHSMCKQRRRSNCGRLPCSVAGSAKMNCARLVPSPSSAIRLIYWSVISVRPCRDKMRASLKRTLVSRALFAAPVGSAHSAPEKRFTSQSKEDDRRPLQHDDTDLTHYCHRPRRPEGLPGQRDPHSRRCVGAGASLRNN